MLETSRRAVFRYVSVWKALSGHDERKRSACVESATPEGWVTITPFAQYYEGEKTPTGKPARATVQVEVFPDRTSGGSSFFYLAQNDPYNIPLMESVDSGTYDYSFPLTDLTLSTELIELVAWLGDTNGEATSCIIYKPKPKACDPEVAPYVFTRYWAA